MVRKTLDRMLSSYPDDPRGLAILIELEAESGRKDAAQAAYDRLARVKPDYPELAPLKDLASLSANDRIRLRRAVQLTRNGNPQQAMNDFDQLFPHGPPDGPEAIQYWEIKSKLPNGWSPALTAIKNLIRKYPDGYAYKLAYAKLIANRYPADSTNLDQLQIMATMSPPFGDDARQVLRGAMLDLPELGVDTRTRLQSFIKQDPEDSAIQIKLRAVEKAQSRYHALITSPSYLHNQQAREALRKQQYAEAMRYYSEVLETRPKDLEAVSGTGYALMRQSRFTEALPWFQKSLDLDPVNRKKWDSLIAACQYWRQMKIARQQSAAGRFDEARKTIQNVIRLNPAESEGYALLASVEIDQGYYGEARKIIGRLPADRQAILEQEIARKRSAASQKLADDLVVKGDYTGARAALVKALRDTPDDPWLRYRLARLYAANGESDKGSGLFDPWLYTMFRDSEAFYAAALYQSGIEHAVTALAILEKLPVSQRTEKITTFQRQIWIDQKVEQVLGWQKSGKTKEATEELRKIQLQVDSDLILLSNVAYAWNELGNHDQANALLLRIKRDSTKDLPLGWHLRYAAYLLRTHQTDPAQQEIEYLEAHRSEFDEKQKIAYSKLENSRVVAYAEKLEREQHYTEAETALGPVLDTNPEDQEAQTLENLLQRKTGNLDKAIQGIEKELAVDSAAPAAYESLAQAVLSPNRVTSSTNSNGLNDDQKEISLAEIGITAHETESAMPSTTGDSWQYKNLAEMQDERTTWLSVGGDVVTRSGTPGQSQFVSHQIPIELKGPAGVGGEWFVRSDQVDVGAGTLNLADTYATETFGSLLICQQHNNCPTPVSQYAFGRSYTVGYMDEQNRLDVGTTPIGFPIQNWVGGIRHTGDWGPYSWSAELARRAVTETLLSYAGTIDPRTGQLWGGVLSTGVKLGLSLDQGGNWGYWSNFGVHQLTGTNVQSNTETLLMAGVTRRLINEEDRLLSTGLTGTVWHFTQDSGEFTYGQGGYYSPQFYTSLAVPLTYAQRYTRFSYMLRASVFTAWARTNASPYYPLNPLYETLAGPGANYNTSAGTSFGYTAMANMEYQLSTNLFVGNSFSVVRSPYYAPNYAILYLRYAIDNTPALPVGLQPTPGIIPTSQF
ncbi:MAG: cellulose synthase subunit BcsC-related outer membrane protein [Ferrovum myxofaciens]|nr:cellulose synthase subunit BcsC-related outer membrane protein [Ferrovum myxofaciens]QWY75623.1 MAG: BCSC C-terminal domain-containing protein [Ferrovum myxofaciens]